MEYLLENRPWGCFKQFTKNQKSTVKLICIKKDGILSKQKHKKRDEFWVVLDNGIKIEIGDKVFYPKKGEDFFIPKNTIHRLSSKTGGRILEISFGEFEEKDIERIEDKYNRK